MSVIVRTVQDTVINVAGRVQHMTNSVFPPKQRERALENLRVFSVHNPKLAFFLAAQVALAGLPILLFSAFAVSTLVVSLITCLFLGLIAALTFTFFTTGLALLFVLPVVFIGSCTASIVFLWGLVGYLVLQRINGGETPVTPGSKVGDTLNELTGGRLCKLVDSADSDTKQVRLAMDPSPNPEVPMGLEGHNTRGGSPRRRNYGQTNGTGYGREAGEESASSGTRNSEARSTRAYPETLTNGHGPTVERVVDWKAEFQQA